VENPESDFRRTVASLAKAFYEQRLTFEQFLKQFPVTNDEEVTELLDLIEHEPKKGGFFGVSEESYREHMEKIYRLIDRLSG